MAFDSSTISTAPVGAPNVLAFITASGALEAYRLATISNHPAHYRDAADQLAAALRHEMRRTREPAAPVQVKAKRQPAPKASPVDPFAAPEPAVPKSKRTCGAFVCTWSDGSTTLVQGVVYHVDKPDGRWPAAFRAADRLRRLRARRDVLAEFDGASPGDLTQRGPLGVEMDSTAFRELLTVWPLPALASITEVGGETFEAPATDYGAGDPERARILAQTCFGPRHPGLKPICYGERLHMIEMARAAFTPEAPAASWEPAIGGESCEGKSLFELDRQTVVFDPAAAQGLIDELKLAHQLADGDEKRWAFSELKEAKIGAAVVERFGGSRPLQVRRISGGRQITLSAGNQVAVCTAALVAALRIVPQAVALAA